MNYIDSTDIIKEVERYPCLYDPNCEDNKSRVRKLEAWLQISKKLVGDSWDNMQDDVKRKIEKDVQKRWRSIKDAFVRSLKSRQRSGTRRRPYYYYKQLRFILPLIQDRTNPEVICESDIEPPECEEIEVEIDQLTNGNICGSSPSTVSPERFSEFGLTIPMKKWKNADTNIPVDGQDQMSFEEKDNAIMYDKWFLLSLLPKVSELNSTDKLDFQIKVLQLLRDYNDNQRSHTH